ncbi:type III secretion system export apparatus subunit SctS [Salmonella enterica]|uniref:EscS/YscS/HrcS family type III secretion system export apparatus protein n=3 Tax=Salmonella enterica TaxID=28901 RepID=A0A2I5HJX8_SALDZ|nr:type III secretion system export apparatus subunit SctS [Salmonella enterica]EBE3717846.1 EscS/YscS/HrcS family type III secretion system export apparatus protein [Salmonella enterica subsp. diarizonae serovar 42:l,v:1,5,7]EBP4002223.1 EscS/YscS/HrcS family type III secretion system export apparatus protein [Salmonella enterica subsp. enterica]EBR3874800.1 EscS/YscS/HrcS family type III secretion system export apparatus protein [Salmonella enterica subsp. arizonae]EBW1590403.1 EscS/YscS/HrcS
MIVNNAVIAHLGVELLWIVVWLSLPTVAAASIVGVLISLIQAVTQIQDQTVPFLIKLVVVSIVLVMTYHWMGNSLINYTNLIFQQINR